MEALIHPLPFNAGSLRGLSERLIGSHHQNNYGGAGAYVDAFMVNIDWKPVYLSYQAAVQAATEEIGCSQDEIDRSVVLDVRRAQAYEQTSALIPGASWRDPAQVEHWSRELQPGGDVVVYCGYGHEVGRATALRLRSAGLNARFLRGGIDGWQAAGRPVHPKGAPE
jgi:superoxide dismutase, Fe-Mn family